MTTVTAAVIRSFTFVCAASYDQIVHVQVDYDSYHVMSAVLDVIVCCCCCCCTVDYSAGVKAAVLLAPVGSDASALWEITHGWRLYVDDLQNTERGKQKLFNRCGITSP